MECCFTHWCRHVRVHAQPAGMSDILSLVFSSASRCCQQGLLCLGAAAGLSSNRSDPPGCFCSSLRLEDLQLQPPRLRARPRGASPLAVLLRSLLRRCGRNRRAGPPEEESTWALNLNARLSEGRRRLDAGGFFLPSVFSCHIDFCSLRRPLTPAL